MQCVGQYQLMKLMKFPLNDNIGLKLNEIRLRRYCNIMAYSTPYITMNKHKPQLYVIGYRQMSMSMQKNSANLLHSNISPISRFGRDAVSANPPSLIKTKNNAEQKIVDELNKHDIVNAWKSVLQASSYINNKNPISMDRNSMESRVYSLKYISTFLKYIVKNKLKLPQVYYSYISDVIDSFAMGLTLPIQPSASGLNPVYISTSINTDRIPMDVWQILNHVGNIHGTPIQKRSIDADAANIDANIDNDHLAYIVYNSIANLINMCSVPLGTKTSSISDVNTSATTTASRVVYDLIDISRILKTISSRFALHPPPRSHSDSDSEKGTRKNKKNITHFLSIEKEKRGLLQIVKALSQRMVLLSTSTATNARPTANVASDHEVSIRQKDLWKINDIMYLVYLLHPIVLSTAPYYSNSSNRNQSQTQIISFQSHSEFQSQHPGSDSGSGSDSIEIRSFLSSITLFLLRVDTSPLSFDKAYVGLTGLQRMNSLHHKEVSEMLNVIALKLRAFLSNSSYSYGSSSGSVSGSSPLHANPHPNVNVSWTELEKCLGVVKSMDIRCKAVRELIRIFTEVIRGNYITNLLVSVPTAMSAPIPDDGRTVSSPSSISFSASRLGVLLSTLRGMPGSDYIETRQLFSAIIDKIPTFQQNPSVFTCLKTKDLLSYMSSLKNMSSEDVEIQNFLNKLIPYVDLKQYLNLSSSNSYSKTSNIDHICVDSVRSIEYNFNANIDDYTNNCLLLDGNGFRLSSVELLKLLSVCMGLSSEQSVVLKFYDNICNRYIATNVDIGTISTSSGNIITTQLLSEAIMGLYNLSSDHDVIRRLLSILNSIVQQEQKHNRLLFDKVTPVEMSSMLYGCKSLSPEYIEVRTFLECTIIPSLEQMQISFPINEKNNNINLNSNNLFHLPIRSEGMNIHEYVCVLASKIFDNNCGDGIGHVLNTPVGVGLGVHTSQSPLLDEKDSWSPNSL